MTSRRADPVPPGLRLAPAPGVHWPAPGTLAGGSPWRVVRLGRRGSRLVERWLAGRPVGSAPGEGALAGRLVDTGLLVPLAGEDHPGGEGLVADEDHPGGGGPIAGEDHPGGGGPAAGDHPGAGGRAGVATVVIPVRDRPEGLTATLRSLPAGVPTVVVDDGSAAADAVEEACRARPAATIVRRPASGGPAAARNDGRRAAASDVIAYVDADCEVPEGWPGALTGHFADPAVAAVACRVVVGSGPAPAWLAAYERHRSPLDLGDRPGPVRPGTRLGYVPSTALLVRAEALDAVGGWDEALRTGEDVDLVWRLVAAGWRVRYDPSVTVAHPARPGALAAARQRFAYGTSAASLAALHGAAVAPLRATARTAPVLLAAASGNWAVAVALAAANAGLAARKAPGVRAAVARAGLRGQWEVVAGAATAVRRTWWPLALLVAVVAPRTRRRLAAAAVLPPLAAWARVRPDGIGPVAWTAAWLADDLAYGAGVWAGAIRARSARCLLPAGPPEAAPSRRADQTGAP